MALQSSINSRPFPILPQCSALGSAFVPHAHTPRGFSFRFCGFFHLPRGKLLILRTSLPLLRILRERYPQKSFESIRGGNSFRASPRISPAGWGARSLRKMRFIRKVHRRKPPRKPPADRRSRQTAVFARLTPAKIQISPESAENGREFAQI